MNKVPNNPQKPVTLPKNLSSIAELSPYNRDAIRIYLTTEVHDILGYQLCARKDCQNFFELKPSEK